jgi:cyclic pyranopterin phosphate synthase
MAVDGDSGLLDRLGRPLRDLRISITDRCNFRCTYCMPKDTFDSKHCFLRRDALLSFEEIQRVVRLFVELGVRKIRLTGGEPLLRRRIETLIEMLVKLPGLEEVAVTTNDSLLTLAKARMLKDAGLERVSISLDALDNRTFREITDVEVHFTRVLEAIEHAADSGLGPVKINMVVKRGVNDHAVLPMARYFRGTPHIVRFIEYMDVGGSNGWRLDDVASASEIIDQIHADFPLEMVSPNHPGEVAKRWRYSDGQGEIGIIASVTRPFCGNCTRARISANGSFYTCLFAARGHDLRGLLREGATDEAIASAIRSVWLARTDRYSQTRGTVTVDLPKIEMSYIGG